MEVLWIENAPGFGGSLTGLLQLAQALPTSIHPTLICPYDPHPFVEIPPRLRVEVVPIDSSRLHRHQTDSVPKALYRFLRHNTLPWYREVVRIGRKYGAELIHANNLVLGNFGAALAGWKIKTPVISHQKGYEHNGRLVREIIQRRWYAHHIATSHSIADHLVSLGVPANRCTMIYDAVVPPDSMPPRSTDPNRPTIAMHSVLRESKGHDVFLRAMAKVVRKHGRSLRVLIAGAPPSASTYPQFLKDLAVQLGIADVVEFVGHQRDPFAFLRSVDISVHASVAPEPFGRVAAESMMMETAVIAASGSGASEYVENAGAGLTTSPGDVDALANAIGWLLEYPADRQRMGRLGREFAEQHFAPSAIATQVVDLYHDVLLGRTPRRTLQTASGFVSSLEMART